MTSNNFQTQVVDSTDVWLVAFYAPWCGHCKALSPEWESAADQLLKEGVMVGAVDATQEQQLGGQFGVKGFPTIKWWPGGKKKGGAAGAQDYQGGRTARDIVAFGMAENDRSGVPRVRAAV